jgi:hypothetical protein
MTLADEIEVRVSKIKKLAEAAADSAVEFHPPATDADIAAAEKRLGFELPASYRALLKIHNGATRLFEFDHLFGTADFASEWYEEQKSWFLGIDYDPKVFESVPILMAEADTGIANFYALDPARRGEEGELEIIDWDHGADQERFPNLLAFLDDLIEIYED